MKALVLIAALTGASVQAQTCAREGLKAIAANYFTAVETHKLSALATTANVRVTENAAEIKAGEGFWMWTEVKARADGSVFTPSPFFLGVEHSQPLRDRPRPLRHENAR